jgi:nucleoside diphosphate kinase
MKEVTFGFVKPHAYACREDIEKFVEDNGLEIIGKKDPYHFTFKDVVEQYEMHTSKPFFEILVLTLLEGPADLLLIYGEDSIQRLIDITGLTDSRLAGKDTIRGRFGIDNERNAFHRADSKKNAKREIYLHFEEEEMSEYALEILRTY